MKRLFTALLCILCLSISAQSDSLSLGAGATNMVFYSLTTHAKTTAPNDDWHIAFAGRYINGFTYQSTSRAAAIRINEAFGLKLFRSPNQKLSQWASFDTTGWQGWQQMHNPDTAWTIGAFNINRNINDQFNYGWGEYNQGDHNIYSDSSIYLIQLPDGKFKKFAVLNLIIDTAFNVQYANLDGSARVNQGIPKAPYSNKNFVYLNLNTSALLDKEPLLSAWDFVALRYNSTNYDSLNTTQDIGILTKDDDHVHAASGSQAQQTCYTGSYSPEINIIGKSWRGTPADTIISGLAYFVQTPISSYRFSMTGFGRSINGELDFTIDACSMQTGITDINAAAALTIYPVPASDVVSIKLNSETESNTDVQVLDMSGRVILSQNVASHLGENVFTINVASIQSGNYIIAISSANGRMNKMISITR
jgi:hypothetical protein